ncbi:MAG: hypothetical protein WAT66_14540 [Actinomycetota bacterium]
MHPVTFVIGTIVLWLCILIGIFPGILSKFSDLIGDGKLSKTLEFIAGLLTCLFVFALIGDKILYFGVLLVVGMICVGIAAIWFWTFIGIPMLLWDKLRPHLLPNAKPKRKIIWRVSGNP